MSEPVTETKEIRLPSEVGLHLDVLLAKLGTVGWPPKHLFGIRLALEEALVNAIKHGNKNDPKRKVSFSSTVTRDKVTFEIQDEGAGFDPDALPDPTAPENVELPGGRGWYLMKKYMTRVTYWREKRMVVLEKDNTPLATSAVAS